MCSLMEKELLDISIGCQLLDRIYVDKNDNTAVTGTGIL